MRRIMVLHLFTVATFSRILRVTGNVAVVGYCFSVSDMQASFLSAQIFWHQKMWPGAQFDILPMPVLD